MIRYTCTAQMSAEQASAMEHESLRRLAGRGPWQVVGQPGAITLTRGSAAAWGPLRPALGGLQYQLAEVLPALGPDVFRPAKGAIPVALRCGQTVAVQPISYDGMIIGLDGEVDGAAGAYGQAVLEAFDLMDAATADNPVPWTHPVLVRAARLALMTGVNLTEELIHAYGLLSTADVWPILEAASGLPKAPAGAGGMPAAVPASTPPA